MPAGVCDIEVGDSAVRQYRRRYPLNEVTVRVNEGASIAVDDVLPDQRLKQRRLANAGLADDVHVGEAVGLLDGNARKGRRAFVRAKGIIRLLPGSIASVSAVGRRAGRCVDVTGFVSFWTWYWAYNFGTQVGGKSVGGGDVGRSGASSRRTVQLTMNIKKNPLPPRAEERGRDVKPSRTSVRLFEFSGHERGLASLFVKFPTPIW